MFDEQKKRVREFYERHQRWFPVGFFLLGFLFDLLTLQRIDQWDVIVQQVLYLALAGWLIAAELLTHAGRYQPPRWLHRVWPYREIAMTFALGTLLNSFTIFYFKSASGISSLLFVLVLVGALTASEFKKFGESQTRFQMILLSLCLISSFQCWVPMVFGFTGVTTFLAAGFAAVLVFGVYLRYLQRRLGETPETSVFIRKQVALPYGVTHAVFVVLYFLHAIPPVPLSVSYLGIYHTVEKRDGQYHLGYTRPWWRFWERGDETFLARPGDAVNAFVQVFSPSGFKDRLQVRWSLYDERRGWQPQDAIPLTITGGRDEGFRAVTRKNHYQPGRWRIQVETQDGREIGRYAFRIIADDSTDERTLRTDVR